MKRGVVMNVGRLHSGGQSYAQRILATDGLYAYWPLDEAAGATTAIDAVGNYNSSSLTNVTFGVEGIGDGNTAARIGNAASDGLAMPNATMAATFPKDEGTLLFWVNGAWGDGATHTLAVFYGDGDNNYYLEKTNANNFQFYRKAATVVASFNHAAAGYADNWILWAMTWSVSGDALKGYINGVQVETTQTNVLAWTAGFDHILIGRSPSGNLGLGGDMAHVALFSRALTGPEILALASF